MIFARRKSHWRQLIYAVAVSLIPTAVCALATAICILSRSLFTL